MSTGEKESETSMKDKPLRTTSTTSIKKCDYSMERDCRRNTFQQDDHGGELTSTHRLLCCCVRGEGGAAYLLLNVEYYSYVDLT